MNRFTARELVTFSPDLSARAARLYLALDEYARESGKCWPSQKTLAARMGCSLRSVERNFAELTKAGLCVAKRKTSGGPNEYFLPHYLPPRVAAPPAKSVGTLPPRVAGLIRKKQDIETEGQIHSVETQMQSQNPRPLPKCGYCHDTGFAGTGTSRGACGGCSAGRTMPEWRRRVGA